MSTKNYPNLNDVEIGWIEQAASFRPDANVEDLINSFLIVFPERGTHDALTGAQIREKLTQRFNDVLYRKDRGYAMNIMHKRQEYAEMFTQTFSVLNPLSMLNFYEQIFTNPKSKPSDKFKAITEAEKLKARLFGEEKPTKKSALERAEEMRSHEINELREKLSKSIEKKRYTSVYSNLPDALKERIKEQYESAKKYDEDDDRYYRVESMAEIVKRVLNDNNMHDEWNIMAKYYYPDPRMKDMPPYAIVALSDRLLHGRIDALSIQEIDAIIDEILDVYI